MSALEIILNLRKELFVPPNDEVIPSIRPRLLRDSSKRLVELARNRFAAAYAAVLRGHISLSELVRFHGVESLFFSKRFLLFPERIMLPVSEIVIHWAVSYESNTSQRKRTRISDDLCEIGRLLVNANYPWTVQSRFQNPRPLHSLLDSRHKRSSKYPKRAKFEADALFGAVATFLLVFELKEELTAAEIIKRLRADGSSFEECVIALLQAIIENSKPEAINDTSKRDESVIKNLHAKLLEKGLNEEQCSFLVNSVWGELSLVDYRGATN